MRKVVIDASVVLKWFPFGDEGGVQEARKIWMAIVSGKLQAYAPVYMLVEVMNILDKKKKVGASDLKRVINRLLNSEISFLETEKSGVGELLELVIERKMSAYDAQYLQVARKKKCQIVSEDEGMLGVGGRTAVNMEATVRDMLD